MTRRARKEQSDRSEMPFLDHLEELRWRIIWALAAILLAVGFGFFLVLRFDVIALLEKPILPYLHGHHVVATHPTDGLQLTISAAIWIGATLSFPVVLYQAWLFLAPALYAREKRLLTAALAGGVVLFAVGATFAFGVVLPLSLPMLFHLFGTALDPMITADNYFDLVFSLVITFGVAFELPVVVLLLAAARLVTPSFLRRYRRHAIVAIITVGAFLTPGGDVTPTIALAVPLYCLYELSVFVAHVIWRQRPSGDSMGEAAALLLAPLLMYRSRRMARVAL
jgi:sec-independent protein translocase protein TatC